MMLPNGSDRAGKEFRQVPPQAAQPKPARGSDLLFQHTHLATQSLRSNTQEGLAPQVCPALRLLDRRDIDMIPTWIRRKRNRNLKGCNFAGLDIARHCSPLAFLDEEVCLRIEELPAQGEILGLPGLAGTVFYR